MAGILAPKICALKPALFIWLAAFVFSLGLTCFIRCRWLSCSAALCLAFGFTGAAFAALERQQQSAETLRLLIDTGLIRPGEPVEITGVLQQEPEAAPGIFYLTLRINEAKLNGLAQPASGIVSLVLPIINDRAQDHYDNLKLHYGTRIRTLATLKREDDFRNPGGSAFREYLDQQGYAATGLVKSPLLIERLGDEQVHSFLALLYEWRQLLQQRINQLFDLETAGLLNASMLGNRYFLSRAASEKLRDGGTFHVLVISGLHITFIGTLVFQLTRRILKRRLSQFLLSALVLWSYAIAVGAEASVVRAAIMFTCMVLAPVVSRRAASLNALGAAALILLAVQPRDLFDPSFQLTFLSVTAIVVFAWPLLQRMNEIGSWRPSRASPYPPSCWRWLRTLSEALYWKDRDWLRESQQINYRYRLFKTPVAVRLESWHLQGLLRYGFAAVVVSACVQVTMLPLLLLYFHRLSISALVLNICVSVIMAILIFTALAALLIAQISSLTVTPLVELSNFLGWLMTHGVDPFKRLGIASIRLPEYSGAWAGVYIAFFLPLLILAISLSRWQPWIAPVSKIVRRDSRWLVGSAVMGQLVLSAVIVLHPFSQVRTDEKLRIDFLDVGQGDSALVTMPDGTTLLIDGGGRPQFAQKNDSETGKPFQRDVRSIGEAVVCEYLWWRGLDRIDYLLATHADADHIAGLEDVARNFNVGAVFVGRTPANDPEFTQFAETMRDQEIPVELIGAGDSLCVDDVCASVLWPMPLQSFNSRSANNESVVLRLNYGERRVLFLADIERQAELALLANLDPDELRADVVKVAHHGSRTSSIVEFVRATNPAYAVISVGRRSIFGHPHREVLERWRASGAEVITTGRNGTITVTTDGKELDVATFVP